MLVDPTGRLLRTSTAPKRRVEIASPVLAGIAADAEDAFRLLHLTVVCPHCGGTPECGNAPSDASWKMDCACTTRVLVNPRRTVQ